MKGLKLFAIVRVEIPFYEQDFKGASITWKQFRDGIFKVKEDRESALVDSINDSATEIIDGIVGKILEGVIPVQIEEFETNELELP